MTSSSSSARSRQPMPPAHPTMVLAGEARLCSGIDAETKEYFDGLIAEVLTAMNAGFSRIEKRLEAVESRQASLESRLERLEARFDALQLRMDEGFIAVDERFRTLELRMEQFETRVTDRLDAMDSRLNDRIGMVA